MSRRRTLTLFIVLLIIVFDVALANIPGPVPTNDAISNVEQNPSFRSIISTANATYTYFGYSDSPTYSTRCVGSVLGQTIHFFSPFHQYTTTSLMFLVQPYLRPGIVSNSSTIPFLLFVKVNPMTGHIISMQRGVFCA